MENKKSRREFLATCAKTVGGAAVYAAILPVVEACAPSTAPFSPDSYNTAPPQTSATVSVSDLSDANPAKFARGVLGPDNLHVLVTRVSDSDYRAFSAKCTHTGCEIQSAAANGAIPCLCHGSLFGLDGSAQKGPATAPLTQYQATFDAGSGKLDIKLS